MRLHARGGSGVHANESRVAGGAVRKTVKHAAFCSRLLFLADSDSVAQASSTSRTTPGNVQSKTEMLAGQGLGRDSPICEGVRLLVAVDPDRESVE